MFQPDGFGWRWRVALLLALSLLVFFCIAQRVHPQEPIENRPSALIESLQQRLQTILGYTVSLEAELQNWKRLSAESTEQARQLSSELQRLKGELQSWQSASEDLQQQVQALNLLYQESESRLKAVLETSRISSDSWRTALEAAARRERRLKLAVVLAAIGAALAGGAVGYLAGR